MKTSPSGTFARRCQPSAGVRHCLRPQQTDAKERHERPCVRSVRNRWYLSQGVDDAIRVGVQRAARTLRGLDWFEVTDIRGHLADGEIEHFQVTLEIGSRMEEPTQASNE